MKGKGRSIATQSNWEALSRCVSSLCLDFLLQEMVSAIHLQGEAVGSEHLECASPLWSPSISQPHHHPLFPLVLLEDLSPGPFLVGPSLSM